MRSQFCLNVKGELLTAMSPVRLSFRQTELRSCQHGLISTGRNNVKEQAQLAALWMSLVTRNQTTGMPNVVFQAVLSFRNAWIVFDYVFFFFWGGVISGIGYDANH